MKLTMYNEKINNPDFLQKGCMRARATVVPSLHKDVYYRNKEESELICVLNGDFKFLYNENDENYLVYIAKNVIYKNTNDKRKERLIPFIEPYNEGEDPLK